MRFFKSGFNAFIYLLVIEERVFYGLDLLCNFGVWRRGLEYGCGALGEFSAVYGCVPCMWIVCCDFSGGVWLNLISACCT